MTRPLVLLLALGAAGCASFETTVAEFDGVTRTGPAHQDSDEINYSTKVDRYPWGLRQIEGTGVDYLFTKILGVQREPTEVDDPVGFARDRIRDLAAKAPTEPAGLAEAVTRLLLVASKDQGALNRADAIQGLGSLASDVPMRLEPPPKIPLASDADRRASQEVVARLSTHWPASRPAPLTTEQRKQHAEALDATASFGWNEPKQRRILVRALRTGYVLERDRELKEATKDALLRVMGAAMSAALWDGLMDPSEIVREEALVSLHTVFGNAALPGALGRLSHESRSGQIVFDTSPDVRRRLLHLLAGLDLAAFQERREGDPSPLQFVAKAATGDPDAGVQMVALRTLAQKLDRPVSYDPAWAREWWADYVAQGRVLQARQ
jgi:hypothetical protein